MMVLAVLTVLAVLESTLRSFCLSFKITYQGAAVAVLAVSAVVAVSVVTATPLKLSPPLLSSWLILSFFSLPRGPCDRKNSIPIENFNPGLKFSIPIEIFKRDRKCQSRSFCFRGPAGVQKRARSNISIHAWSLEIFNPEGRDRFFRSLGPLGGLFEKLRKNPRKHRGFSDLANSKSLWNKQKTLKKTKEILREKTTKETKTPRKRRTG